MDASAVARQLVRSIRGHRSQVALSRRLGFRGNPVADWESGRREPTAAGLLHAARRCGLDVDAAFVAFHAATAPALGAGDDAGVAAWLSALRGGTAISDVAARSGLSRFQVSRVLSGQTRPRLTEWLLLVEALTGRVDDWVAALVPIETVPALAEVHGARQASRRILFEEPWAALVLSIVETTAYQGLDRHVAGWIAERLGVPVDVEARAIDALVRAGALTFDGCRYTNAGPLTIDTQAAPSEIRALKAHWAAVGLERIGALGPNDLASYNTFSVSKADLARIRELHRAYFREVRAIVAGSSPNETVALLNVQLFEFEL
jgi:DNA-binding phage protein